MRPRSHYNIVVVGGSWMKSMRRNDEGYLSHSRSQSVKPNVREAPQVEVRPVTLDRRGKRRTREPAQAEPFSTYAAWYVATSADDEAQRDDEGGKSQGEIGVCRGYE